MDRCISPSGLSFTEISPEDIVGIDIKSKTIVFGNKKPSSETAMHVDIYRARDDVNVILHTHPPTTIGIIGAGAEIKALFPDFAVYLGSCIPVIEYTTPCTEELAIEVSKILKNTDAVALKKHGLTVVAGNFKEAWVKTVLIEETCKMMVAARAFGKEAILTDEEVYRVNNLEIEKYRKSLLKDN